MERYQILRAVGSSDQHQNWFHCYALGPLIFVGGDERRTGRKRCVLQGHLPKVSSIIETRGAPLTVPDVGARDSSDRCEG